MATRLPVRTDAASVVDVQATIAERLPKGKVRIELLTDPWSVWCWGFEPVRRALQLRYPDIQFRFLLGGMFESLPPPEQLGFDVERFFSIVQRTTGMPLRADATRRDRPTSTYPACIHVHTVRLLAPEREESYLRALREAAYYDARNISRDDVGADVAQQVGVDREAFLQMRQSGKPEAAFRTLIEGLRERGLHGYPTILISCDGKTHVVEGFQSLPAILGIVQSIAGRLYAPTPDPSLSVVIPPLERVATREVAEVLGVSIEKAYQTCAAAEETGLLRREEHPSGIAWSQTTSSPSPARAKKSTRTTALITPEP
jgi:putative protein-disulfide isomerase